MLDLQRLCGDVETLPSVAELNAASQPFWDETMWATLQPVLGTRLWFEARVLLSRYQMKVLRFEGQPPTRTALQLLTITTVRNEARHATLLAWDYATRICTFFNPSGVPPRALHRFLYRHCKSLGFAFCISCAWPQTSATQDTCLPWTMLTALVLAQRPPATWPHVTTSDLCLGMDPVRVIFAFMLAWKS